MSDLGDLLAGLQLAAPPPRPHRRRIACRNPLCGRPVYVDRAVDGYGEDCAAALGITRPPAWRPPTSTAAPGPHDQTLFDLEGQARAPMTPPTAGRKVWLFNPPAATPLDVRDALLDWARANHIDPEKAIGTDSVEVDLDAREIRYSERVHPNTPGATWERNSVWKRRRTVPLLVDPPEVLLQPPYGHTSPPAEVAAALYAAAGGPPTIAIVDAAQRPLLALRVVDGRLTAQYDPANLDEAARAFAEEVLRVAATFRADRPLRLAAAGAPPSPADDAPASEHAEDLQRMHTATLTALDRLAAIAVDAGGIALAGQWHVAELVAGRGVADRLDHLVYADQGDPAQLDHTALWCPAHVLPMLATRRTALVAHAPDRHGNCSTCVDGPIENDVAYPCDVYRSHLTGMPGLPPELLKMIRESDR